MEIITWFSQTSTAGHFLRSECASGEEEYGGKCQWNCAIVFELSRVTCSLRIRRVMRRQWDCGRGECGWRRGIRRGCSIERTCWRPRLPMMETFVAWISGSFAHFPVAWAGNITGYSADAARVKFGGLVIHEVTAPVITPRLILLITVI